MALSFYACNELYPERPAFHDNGKAIDSIRDVYAADSIEFENWGDGDHLDSTLTVGLVNCKRMPALDSALSANEIRGIASVIHHTLVDKARYRSYYIVFVESENSGAFKMPYGRFKMKVWLEDIIQ